MKFVNSLHQACVLLEINFLERFLYRILKLWYLYYICFFCNRPINISQVVNEIRSSIDLVAYLNSKKEDSEK